MRLNPLFPRVNLRTHVSLSGGNHLPLTLYPIIECFLRGLMGEFPHVVMKTWVEYKFEIECKSPNF